MSTFDQVVCSAPPLPNSAQQAARNASKNHLPGYPDPVGNAHRHWVLEGPEAS